ncbi:MAG: acetate--CoA ligase family protein [Burkholderiales bacterium]|nr:acetate--CoA ligase family protein [Burkholderiales bacterium]
MQPPLSADSTLPVPPRAFDPEAVHRLLNPYSVAVIGASDDSEKFGGRAIEYLVKFGFPGIIVPVNPRVASVRGIRAYPSVSQCPHAIDVALIAAPVNHVLPALNECSQAGVRACVVITAQFAEIGEEGERRQDEIVRVAHRHGMRLLGPNCLGYVNMHARTAATATLALSSMTRLRAGGIGLVSQSGALMGSLIAVGDEAGVRFSSCVSVGNQCDLETADFVHYLAQDPTTRVICLYVEGLAAPDRFLEAVDRARAHGKRVLMVKAGRTQSGAVAVKSHTASLAGSYPALQAVCEAHGVLLLDDIFDMLLVAECLNRHGRLRGDGIAMFSSSGGAGASLVDALADRDIRVATLHAQTTHALASTLPQTHRQLPIDFGVARVNTRGETADDTIRRVLATVMSDSDVAAGVVVLTTGTMMESMARGCVEVGNACAKPLLWVNTSGRAGASAQAIIEQGGQLTCRSPQEAVRTIACLVTDFRRAAIAEPVAQETLELDEALAELSPGVLNEGETKRLLAAAGVPVTRESLARNEHDAARIAGKIGFPVVLKVQAPGVSHKSDVGGVALDLGSEGGVRTAYRRIVQELVRRTGTQPDGCLVQEMVAAEAEIIVGTKWDAQFGAMILVGSGGILVELLGDVRLAPAPVAAHTALAMLRSLKLAALLTGYRGKAGIDLDAVAAVVARISQLAAHMGPRLLELDANPLIVTRDRVVVADARAVLGR